MSKEKQAWEVYVDDPEGVREVVFTGSMEECIKFQWSLDIRKKEVKEMEEMIKRIEELEKRLAALEGRVQAQPDDCYTLEDYHNDPKAKLGDWGFALESEIKRIKQKLKI